LTGDGERDRAAILARAAERLQAPVPGGTAGTAEATSLESAALLGEIAVELLAADAKRGLAVVQQAVAVTPCRAERLTPAEMAAPERTGIGLLLRLARAAMAYPALADAALRKAYECAEEGGRGGTRILALCLFAREAAALDQERAGSALRQARGMVFQRNRDAPADPMAVVAATTARLEGKEASRPLVEEAVRSIPSGAARPLVQARLAAWLAEAAPAEARELARQAGSGIEIEGQRRAIATLLAVSHPEAARRVVAAIRSPGERVATLIDMGATLEARAPLQAAALYRRALAETSALPMGEERRRAVIGAATGLAAYDLAAARRAVDALPGAVPAIDMMMLGVRAAKREPEAARRLIEAMWNRDPASEGRIEGSHEISLAQVRVEPDLDRALAMAQQGRSRELQAEALLMVARRLKTDR
jgi:hypothetical protein